MAAITLFLALMLLVSAAHKLIDRPRLALAAARLAGTGPGQGALLLAVSGALEGVAALALLIPQAHAAGVALAVLVWGAYGLALFRHRGQALDCGCDLVAREKPVGAFVIARPFVLAALACLTLAVPGAGGLTGWTPDAPFAALALLALTFAGAELAGLPHARKGAVR